MNQLRKVVGHSIGAFAILLLVMGLIGCESPTFNDEIVPPTLKGGTNAAGTNATGANRPPHSIDVFRVGDTVLITFSGMDPVIPPYQETIKEDTSISPPEISKSVTAAGKTPGELQTELLKEYKKIYVHPTVTVQFAVRFYHILGDVNHPGPQQYLGQTDVIKAIAAAGGLTEFADKGDIQLTRAGSTNVFHINYKRATRRDAKHNLPVYPGDTIFVPRSIL